MLGWILALVVAVFLDTGVLDVPDVGKNLAPVVFTPGRPGHPGRPERGDVEVDFGRSQGRDRIRARDGARAEEQHHFGGSVVASNERDRNPEPLDRSQRLDFEEFEGLPTFRSLLFGEFVPAPHPALGGLAGHNVGQVGGDGFDAVSGVPGVVR